MRVRLHGAILLLATVATPVVLGAYGQVTASAPTGEIQLIEQAQALISAGQLEEAERAVEAAIRLYPRSGGLYNLLGIAAAQHNKNDEAKSAFLQAVKYSPNLVPAYLNLARMQHQEGQQSNAIETYRRVLRLNPNLDEARGNLGALMLTQGAYEEAGRQFQALSPGEKMQNRFLAMKCAALAGAVELEKAEDIIQRLRPPVSEQDVSLAAFTLAKLGRSSLVVQMVEPVLPNGASTELRGLLATAYAQTDRLAQARTVFDSIVREDPTQEQPLIDAARVAYRQNDFEGSAGYLLHTLEIDKQNSQLQFFFGIVCIRLNLPGDALSALKEAVRLQPENALANYALGAAMLTGDKSGDAVFYFRKYLQLRPADARGRFALAVAEFEAQDNESARRDLLPLIHDSSVSFGAHYILGKIYREENDYEPARDHFLAALKMDERNADLHANLAIVYIRQNRLVQAREELDRALTLDPDSYLANENLLLVLRKTRDPRAEQQAQKFASVTQKVSDEQKLLLRHIDIQHPGN
jgi:tetratricopeptide (TPR) repeat protein